jgi:hypothetical protein
MAKQGKGGPTPPPDDKNPGESDILEVFPEDEPTPPKKPARKQVPGTQLGHPKTPGESDIVEVVPEDEATPPKKPVRKQGVSTQLGTPPSPGESDIVEVFPQDEPAPTRRSAQKPPTDPDVGGPGWVEAADVVDEVEIIEEGSSKAGPAAQRPVPLKGEIEEVKRQSQKPKVEPTAAFEDVHEVDLWEDVPAEVEVVNEAEEKKPDEASSPKTKTPPDDVAGADDFVEIIDPAATLTATLPPEKVPAQGASDEDLILDVTPGPKSAPTSKGDLATHTDKIAEALESGTDIAGEGQSVRNPRAVVAPEVDYASDLDKSSESSAVDLGQPPPSKERDRAVGEEDYHDAAGLGEAVPNGLVGKTEESPELMAEEKRGPSAKVPKKKPEQKPGFGLRWVAGIVIGTVLGGSAAAGLAYTGLLGPAEKKAPPVPAGPKITLAQQAHTAVDRGDYEEAIQLLQGSDKSSPEELSVRGEARWLKYLKEQKEKKAPPSASDEAVKQALADLKEANDEMRQQQITLALSAGPDETTKKLLQKSEVNLDLVRKQLQKSEQGFKAAQAENANLVVKQKALGKDIAQLSATRKKLDANLAEINEHLKAAKVPDGPQGVRQLAVAKDKLEAERSRLDAVVKQAVQELETGKILQPGATEKDLLAGVKAARDRGDSPLAAPLARGVSLLAGASEQATQWLQQNAKNAASQTELALFRLREPLVKTPEQRLDSWVVRLRSGALTSPTDLDEARRDAEWILANSGKRSPELKHKAELIQALAAKDRGGSAAARDLLDRIVKESAAKNPAAAAEASFDLGRMDEAQGELAKAEERYRQAIKYGQASPQSASRYRAALARVILMRLDPAPEEVPPAKEQKTGRLSLPSLQALFLTALLVEGGEETPVQDKRLQEALDLANELLKSENREDKGNAHLILGKVYTLQGKKTEGLKEYVLGLQLLYPGFATKDLSRLIDAHPAFEQPDSQMRASVEAASQHFARGLQRFWERQYPKAEEELKQAVANFPEDARYRYFLGLSRYLQNSKAKREAASFDFEQAARLERFNRPDTVVVNSSFERLPYSLRQMLNRYRQKSPTPPPEDVTGR